MKKQRNGFLVNLLLLLLVCFLFFVTDANAPERLAAVAASAPLYGGKGEGAALLCTVDYDAAALGGILDLLRDAEMPITFAVSGQWARENGAMLRRMAAEGHEIATLGDDADFDGRGAALRRDIAAGAAAIEAACGVRPAFYCSGTRALRPSARAAKAEGLMHVRYGVDLRSARGSAADILLRASKAAADGNIIRVQPTGAFLEALDGIVEILQKKGMDGAKVSSVL